MFARSTKMGIPEPLIAERADRYGTHAFSYINQSKCQRGEPGGYNVLMDNIVLPQCQLPDDGLRFIYRLSCWSEYDKNNKAKLKKWSKAIKKPLKLKCLKPKTGIDFVIPEVSDTDTLYIPSQNYGIRQIIRHIRNAFCHNNVEYDEKTDQYIIRRTDKVKIAGSFSLPAIQELISRFIELEIPNNNNLN